MNQPYNDPTQQQPHQPAAPGPYPPQPHQPISGAPVSPQYPPPGGPAPYQPQPIIVQGPPTSGMAVTSLVLGILGLVSLCCSFGVFSLAAVIAGHIAIGETKSGQKGGHGLAVAGLVMGYVVLLPAILFSIWMVLGAGLSAIDPSPVVTPTP